MARLAQTTRRPCRHQRPVDSPSSAPEAPAIFADRFPFELTPRDIECPSMKLQSPRADRSDCRHFRADEFYSVSSIRGGAIFRRTQDVSVITTNYDVLPERGIRHRPRPRVPRPGFHYGDGPEQLAGGGYPSYSHIQKIATSGTVPIYKLHGSVSWSYRGSKLVRYHDCRPAIRGDAAIVAPVTAKALPHYLHPVWRGAEAALRSSRLWLVVGYSLPDYDHLVRGLLERSASPERTVHVFDPDDGVSQRFQSLLPDQEVRPHPGLPEGVPQVESLMDELARTAA
jgi:hypothetical protein